MKHAKTKQVIKNIAHDHNISQQDAENVITTVFEFVRYVQSECVDRDAGIFPSVRVPNFAIFYVQESNKESLIAYNKKMKDNESNRV